MVGNSPLNKYINKNVKTPYEDREIYYKNS